MDPKVQAAIHHFDLNVESSEAVPESFSSIVRVLTLASGEKVILKLPFNRHKLQRETRILTLLQNRLPVPKVLDTWMGDGEIAGALLLSWLPGMPSTPEVTLTIAYAMGELLAQLHQVHTKGFGDDYDIESDATDWRRMLAESIMGWESECAALLPKQFVRKSIATYHAMLEEMPPPDGPCVVHMDFRPGNILVNEEQIVGLIDFESARGGSAERDFTKIKDELWETNHATKAPFLAGYSAVRPLPDLATALPFSELQNALGGIGWCVRRNQINDAFFAQNVQIAERLIDEHRDIAN